MTETTLREVLLRLELQDARVDIDGSPRHWVAQISSPTFASMEAHVRQSMVWTHLLKELPESEAVEVEYVFTVTPDEIREMEQQLLAG